MPVKPEGRKSLDERLSAFGLSTIETKKYGIIWVMMNGNGIESLYGSVLYAPYSQEEAKALVHSPMEPIRAVLDDTRHRYIAMIGLIDHWMDYCGGHVEKPADSPMRFIIPGRSDENNELDNYEKITSFFSTYPHGSTPHMTEFCDASRICLTFLSRLATIKTSSHLSMAWQHFCDFLNLIDYKGEPLMLREEFRQRMSETCDSFFHERAQNAWEIGEILSSPKCGAAATQEFVPQSVRRDQIRMRAVSLIKAYQKKMGCSRNEAIRKVKGVLWRDFHALGLGFDVNNFGALFAMAKFKDAPPGSDEDLRRACLDFGC